MVGVGPVGVNVNVFEGVRVMVGVRVLLGVTVKVGVLVLVEVGVGVSVGGLVGVLLGVNCGVQVGGNVGTSEVGEKTGVKEAVGMAIIAGSVGMRKASGTTPGAAKMAATEPRHRHDNTTSSKAMALNSPPTREDDLRLGVDFDTGCASYIILV